MKVTLIFFFFLFSNMAYSQLGSVNEIISCHPCGSDIVLKGDIDLDGITDLLFYSEIDQKMAWIKNDGIGNFVARTRLPDYKGIIDLIQLADLDGDGDLDLYFASKEENTIGWFKNEADGQFSAPPILISNEIDHARSGAIADIDKDGDVDLVVSSYDEKKIIIFENDGLGNFRIEQVIESEKEKTGMLYLEDLDGDMDLDLYATYGSGLSWFNNDGTGHFDTLTLIDDYTWVGRADFADFDGDGDIDIITPKDSQDKFGWYENEGKGQFKEKQIIDGVIVRETIQAVDMDLDGDMDLVSFEVAVLGTIFWLENDGLGNFSEPKIIAKDIQWLESFSVFDIDGDGDQDVAVGGKFEERGRWFEQRENNTYTERLFPFAEILGLRSLKAEDLDHDGDADILAVGLHDKTLSWFANDGKGNFSEKKLISTKNGMYGQAYTADIDLDGDQDIFYADRDTLGWFENDGNGQFIKQHLIDDYSVGTITFAAEDFDLDGDIDVISTGYGHFGYVFFHVNDGMGNFTRLNSNFSNRDDGIVQAADLDGDGDKDLLLSSVYKGRVSWLENDRTTTTSSWEEHFFPSNKEGWADVIALDIDRDKDLDIVISSKIGVEWFENNGQGGFTLKQTFANEESTWRRVSSTDLDKDGWLDVLVIAPQNNEVTWFRNDGLGNFLEKRIVISNLKGVHDISLADMDGDGDEDFVTLSEFNKIAWFENLFGEATIKSVTYFDKNKNGIYEEEDELLPNLKVQLEPLALATFADTTGVSEFFLYDGDYTLTALPDSCYVLTTDSINYQLSLSKNQAEIRYFGFAINDSIQKVQPRIVTNPIRCGFTVNLWLSISNEGCVKSKGQYGLILDSLVTFLDTIQSPLYTVQGDTLLWNFDSLLPNTTKTLSIPLTVAGTEHIGDTVRLKGVSFIEQADGTFQGSESYEFLAEIRCAYDPNDKLVLPNRTDKYEENYTLFEENLEYTIRFQNTGTDTAFNVIIKDYLDENLDWTTFKPITSSHEMATVLRKTGLIEFSFTNILLPDSTTNEALSHGFITYTISPKKQLVENTLVENTAHIFFDFNPPIVTNTIQNRYVSAFPKDLSTAITKPNGTAIIKVYPNPFNEQLNFEYANFNSKHAPLIRLFDVTGKLIKQTILESANFQMSLPTVNNGLYFYQIINPMGHIIASEKVVKNNGF